MATALQLRRGTTAQNNAFTGAAGELSYDTATEGLRVHDGSTAGGFEILPSHPMQHWIWIDSRSFLHCVHGRVLPSSLQPLARRKHLR